MGTGGWLGRLVKDEGADPRAQARPGPALIEPQQEAAAGLNFRKAIEAHQKWKTRLQAVIEMKSDEALDPKVVCRDDQCDLGKWIHGAGGGQFTGDPQFVELRRKHAYFHVCAGRVLSLAQAGQKDRAMVEMASMGEFSRVSRAVVGDLASLFVRLNEAK